jgi:hypothetical protein
MQASCTILSISSVVTPGFAAAAAMSRISLASRQLFLIAFCPSSSNISILFRFSKVRLYLGLPSSHHTGCGIVFGNVRWAERGYTGRRGPENGKFGNGLYDSLAVNGTVRKASSSHGSRQPYTGFCAWTYEQSKLARYGQMDVVIG